MAWINCSNKAPGELADAVPVLEAAVAAVVVAAAVVEAAVVEAAAVEVAVVAAVWLEPVAEVNDASS